MARNTIQEIKAGQTGTGLLIEHDGYISMSEGKNKTLMEFFKNLAWKMLTVEFILNIF